MEQFRPQRFDILPLVVKNLLIINGLLFAATFVFRNALNIDLVHVLGLHFVTSDLFRPHQFVTHMFMHGSFMHIFSNMFALWMFGSALENVWGPKRFLIFYFACGFGGALLHLGVSWWSYHQIAQDVAAYQLHPGLAAFVSLIEREGKVLSESYAYGLDQFYRQWYSNPGDPALIEESKAQAGILLKAFADIPIVGASGAVFGVLIAFGLLFPNTYLYVYFFFPIKAKYFVILYAAFELYAGFTGAEDGIAHFAHLGGALVGYLLVKFWNRKLRRNFY